MEGAARAEFLAERAEATASTAEEKQRAHAQLLEMSEGRRQAEDALAAVESAREGEVRAALGAKQEAERMAAEARMLRGKQSRGH